MRSNRSVVLAILLAALTVVASPSRALAQFPVHSGVFSQDDPTPAADGAGGAYVAYLSSEQSFVSSVRVRRTTSSGDPAPGWPATGLLLSTDARRSGTFGNLRAVPDAAGGAFIVWFEVDGFDVSPLYRPRVQHVLADGTTDPAWPDSGIVGMPHMAPVMRCAAAADGQGGLLLVWQISENGTASHYRVQRLTVAGESAAGWPDSGFATGPGETFALVPDGSGGAIVAWSTPSQTLASHFPAAGGASDWSNVVLRNSDPDPPRPSIQGSASDGAGGAYVMIRDGSSTYLQRVDASGARPAPWSAGGREVVPGSTAVFEHLVADGSGGVYAGWIDGGLRTLRIDPDATDAEGWPAGGMILGPSGHFWRIAVRQGGGVFGTGPSEDNVRVNVLLADGTRPAGWDASGIPIDPRPETQAFPRIIPDGNGGAIVAWVDYRDSATHDADIYGARIAPDGTVGVPGAGERPVLSLAARPNPSAGPVVLDFAIHRDGEVTIELLDVTGRRIHAESAFRSAGRHTLALTVARGVAPGVYLARITHAARSATARVVLAR